MKTIAVSLFGLLSRIGASVGLEGTFLLIGTTCLSVFAWSITPYGPWLVIGAMSILAGIALAIPGRH